MSGIVCAASVIAAFMATAMRAPAAALAAANMTSSPTFLITQPPWVVIASVRAVSNVSSRLASSSGSRWRESRV
ncbi:Uncharacterised protein [Mycobacteroides abscessus]|nr:Uncharacterised protein [Mycobacteroides abscessus]CQA12530.1 Uncharacterised protein [Mycobacteroides abscessus]